MLSYVSFSYFFLYLCAHFYCHLSLNYISSYVCLFSLSVSLFVCFPLLLSICVRIIIFVSGINFCLWKLIIFKLFAFIFVCFILLCCFSWFFWIVNLMICEIICVAMVNKAAILNCPGNCILVICSLQSALKTLRPAFNIMFWKKTKLELEVVKEFKLSDYIHQISFDLINPKQDFVLKKLKMPQLTLPKSNKMATAPRLEFWFEIILEKMFRKKLKAVLDKW